MYKVLHILVSTWQFSLLSDQRNTLYNAVTPNYSHLLGHSILTSIYVPLFQISYQLLSVHHFISTLILLFNNFPASVTLFFCGPLCFN